MTDDQLWARYDKMNKPDKIEAFLNALVQENRNEDLQLEIARDNGLQVGPVNNFSSWVLKHPEKDHEFIFIEKDENIFVEEWQNGQQKEIETDMVELSHDAARVWWQDLIHNGFRKVLA